MITTLPQIFSPRSKNRFGFTLVELLVCITIIIVLAALIFATTSKIRDSARQANAVAALRQITMANVAYSAENSGAINVIRDAGERGAFEGPGVKWVSNSFMGRMQPYLFSTVNASNERELGEEIQTGLSNLLQTTDIRNMAGTIFSGVPVTTDGSAVRNPISVNDQLRPRWGAINPPLRVSSFGNPGTILYLTFGKYYFNAAQCSAYRPLPLPGDTARTPYFLPNRKAIFSFLDGHVESLPTPIPEHLFGERPW